MLRIHCSVTFVASQSLAAALLNQKKNWLIITDNKNQSEWEYSNKKNTDINLTLFFWRLITSFIIFRTFISIVCFIQWFSRLWHFQPKSKQKYILLRRLMSLYFLYDRKVNEIEKTCPLHVYVHKNGYEQCATTQTFIQLTWCSCVAHIQKVIIKLFFFHLFFSPHP